MTELGAQRLHLRFWYILSAKSDGEKWVERDGFPEIHPWTLKQSVIGDYAGRLKYDPKTMSYRYIEDVEDFEHWHLLPDVSSLPK